MLPEVFFVPSAERGHLDGDHFDPAAPVFLLNPAKHLQHLFYHSRLMHDSTDPRKGLGNRHPHNPGSSGRCPEINLAFSFRQNIADD